MTNTQTSICEEVGLLTADEISNVLQVSTKTLTTWRWKRRGPPSIKLGKKVFYLMADFAKWMQDESTRQKSNATLPPRRRKPNATQPDRPALPTQLDMESYLQG